MKTKYLQILLLTVIGIVDAQWSTSIKPESTLYACPGFEPGIITYSDGSSLILGALSGSIYARKLDEFGNYLWPAPVRLFLNNNAETDVGSLPAARRRWYTSDGNGGALVYWYDYLGSTFDAEGNESKSLFVQRVDKNGNVKWGNGVKLAGVETGLKSAFMVDDNLGGCVVAWIEADFGFPQSNNYIGLQIAHVNSSGTIQWKKLVTSGSDPSHVGISGLSRISNQYYFQTNLGTYILNQDSTFATNTPIQNLGALYPLNDTLFYSLKLTNKHAQDSTGREYYQIGISKFNLQMDTLWSNNYWILSGMEALSYNDRFIRSVDTFYFCFAMYGTPFDSTIVYRLTPENTEWVKPLIVANNLGLPTFGADKKNGIIIGSSDFSARKYDKNGISEWPNTVKMLVNAQDAYFSVFESDNNGGMIVAYWTTFGGIFVRHSGRNGKLGVLTKIYDLSGIPITFTLFQNYPNPFNGKTKIKFSIPNQSDIILQIYDITGRKITRLVDARLERGTYEAQWDASNYASGLYFYSLTINQMSISIKKMILLK